MAINRKALVSRHDPVLRSPDPFSPLSVGNGEFAFTADATGLQTILPAAEGVTPLCTMAQWGWHSYGLEPGECRDRSLLRMQSFDAGRRRVGYMTDASGQEGLFAALRVNPHRLNLARVGFVRARRAGLSGEASARGPRAPQAPVSGEGPPFYVEPLLAEVGYVEQRLTLWEGLLDSFFTLGGEAARVRTVVHPRRDVLSFRVESAALKSGALAVRLSFPYGSHESDASDWFSPEKHRTVIVAEDGESLSGGARQVGSDRSASGRKMAFLLERSLDGDRYYVALGLGPGGSARRSGAHEFILRSAGPVLEVSLGFSPGPTDAAPPSWDVCRAAAAAHWADFWESGGAVELAESADLRAFELERRIVLSHYLTAIQCSGSLPPQETGLTCNSWYGKFHLEMHYWHAAHFVQWSKPELLERSLGWYRSVLDGARKRAASQGYKGARWPKMTDPGGEDSPSPIGPLLCWQQPHPIMYAELLRRAGLGREVLAPYADLVFETAEFMADYVRREGEGGRYVLGPPLIPAQECHAPADVLNPAFELEYWRWGLETALAWAGEGGSLPLRRSAWTAATRRWKAVLAGLASLPIGSSSGGLPVYLAHEGCPDTFTRFNIDHPSMLLALGMLPGGSVDRAAMSATWDRVMKSWDFETCWGWDFPAMAMTAARLGRPRDAVEALFMDTPKNTWRRNGHNAQLARASGPRLAPSEGAVAGVADLLFTTKLPLYLPGNGALLLAVGMMASGWDGSSDRAAPGFPGDGSWKVSVEGIARLP